MHTRLEDAACSDILRVLDPEQFSKFRTSTMNPALDRASSRSTDFSSFLVGKTLRGHQQKRLTLFDGKVGQGSPEAP